MTSLLPGLLMLGVMFAVGIGLSITLMRVRRTRREFERHVRLVAGAAGKGPAIGSAEQTELREAGWQMVLGRHARAVFAVHLPHDWGMTAGVLTLVLGGVGGAGITWLALHATLGWSIWIAMPLTVLAFFMTPRAILKRQQSAAESRFTEAFPDTIDMVIRMLRAGLPVTAAVRAVGEEAVPPVNALFTNLADKMAIGISFEDALSEASRRIGLPDFAFFAVAISLQRSTGGNLAATLDILSDLMRKRRATRLKAQATTGEVRMSAYVLGGIPFFIIGGLLIMTPAYLRPLVEDPRGRVIIAIATTSMLIGFAIIRQMMRGVTNAT